MNLRELNFFPYRWTTINGAKFFYHLPDIKKGIHTIQPLTTANPAECLLHDTLFALEIEGEFASLLDACQKENQGKEKPKPLPTRKKFVEKIAFDFAHDVYFKISHEEIKQKSSNPLDYAFFSIPDKKDLQDGLTPAWDEFLSRVQFPEHFLAWIWSIFEENDFGRKIFWFVSQGNDGKGKVLEALTEFVGLQNTASGVNVDEKSFFFAQVYGKSLVTIPDCKKQNVLQYESIHNITGGDYVQINQKGLKAFSASVYAKLIICMNNPPEINTENRNEASRVIISKIEPFTQAGAMDYLTWRKELKKEKFTILYKARECYKKLFDPQSGEIHFDIEHVEENSDSTESSIIHEFLEEHCQIFPPNHAMSDLHPDSAKVHQSDISRAFLLTLKGSVYDSPSGGIKSRIVQNLHRFLQKHPDIKKVKVKGVRYYRGIMLKDAIKDVVSSQKGLPNSFGDIF